MLTFSVQSLEICCAPQTESYRAAFSSPSMAAVSNQLRLRQGVRYALITRTAYILPEQLSS